MIHDTAIVPAAASSRKHQSINRASRNRVGTVGTALETVVDTVVNHVETVNFLFEVFKFKTLK